MEKMEQTEKIEKIEKSAAPKRQAKNSNLTFEEALKRLEEIVSLLNSGNAPLDKSLAMF